MTAEARRETGLAARAEPFDSFWQGPEEPEQGYRPFRRYYEHNLLPWLPEGADLSVLVVSAGPGYLVELLGDRGYRDVLGTDSDPAKAEHARRRGLNVRVAEIFPFLEGAPEAFDVIIAEQELNHLTKAEMIAFLELAYRGLRPGGTLVVHGINGANPVTGAESLAQNIDHFHTFTEYSLTQALELAGFEAIRPFPLRLYVFWGNPLNYVGLLATGVLELGFRLLFRLYGKSNRIFTKKLGAACRRPA